MSADEEGFENLNTMASTFIVLFLLSLFYSTTVTLFKVEGWAGWRAGREGPEAHWEECLTLPVTSGEVTRGRRVDTKKMEPRGAPAALSPGPGLHGGSTCT